MYDLGEPGYFLYNAMRPGTVFVHRVGFDIHPLARLNFFMCLSSQISIIMLFCSGSTYTNFSFDSNRMCNFRLEKPRFHWKYAPRATGYESLSWRVVLALLRGISVVQEC